MLVVGPARSGKTVIAIGAILEHDWGPVIASSVKTDLLAATITRRAQLGNVAIFDPLGVVPTDQHPDIERVGWSPLSTCTTAIGAQQVASQLLDAAPIDASVRNNDFWANHAHRLAWVTLYAAALDTTRTMRHVLLWTNQPPSRQASDPARQAVADILRTRLAHPADDTQRDDCELALSIIEGIWADSDDTRSGIYASTQTLFAPWQDNRIAANAALPATIDLDWLLNDHHGTETGRNTLYVCMPEHPKEAARFAVVFGGLISSLTDAAYARRNATNRPITNLLLVLDEAGNTAASWLPEISTTCASVGITLMTFWQSLAQIQHRYRDQAPTLLTNHLTKIFFGGISDHTTATTATQLAGTHEVPSRSRSVDRRAANRDSESLSAATAALVPSEMLRQIQPGHALCIHGTLQPIHLRTRRYWTDRTLGHEPKAAHPTRSAEPTKLKGGPSRADCGRTRHDRTDPRQRREVRCVGRVDAARHDGALLTTERRNNAQAPGHRPCSAVRRLPAPSHPRCCALGDCLRVLLASLAQHARRVEDEAPTLLLDDSPIRWRRPHSYGFARRARPRRGRCAQAGYPWAPPRGCPPPHTRGESPQRRWHSVVGHRLSCCRVCCDC